VDLADIAAHVSGAEIRTDPAEAPTYGDPVLLERLVQNLVENAVRHNETGGWVHVSTGTKDGLAVLEVANTGPVVPPYEVEGLFEPFRRLGTDRLAGPGIGLGLSIVRAVARAHDGEARAVPRPEGGLVVTVTLPGAPPVRPG
jgi:signal transduction histidine kinase